MRDSIRAARGRTNARTAMVAKSRCPGLVQESRPLPLRRETSTSWRAIFFFLEKFQNEKWFRNHPVECPVIVQKSSDDHADRAPSPAGLGLLRMWL